MSRPKIYEDGRKLLVLLNGEQIAMAAKLGNGNVTAGIRIALDRLVQAAKDEELKGRRRKVREFNRSAAAHTQARKERYMGPAEFVGSAEFVTDKR